MQLRFIPKPRKPMSYLQKGVPRSSRNLVQGYWLPQAFL